ncbi:MAG: pilus assembly FimT family protein [Cellulosilyticaceae bacterium]
MQKGFTLIEMVVVLAIMSMGYVGITGGIRWLDQIKLEACVQEVVQCIEIGQNNASLQNKEYAIEPYGNEGEQIVRLVANQGTYAQVEVPSSIVVWCNTGSVVFNGDLSPARAGTLFLRHQGLRRRVEIRVRPVTGEVAVYDFEI